MNTHERAKLMFEDGDWAMMKGPLSWFMDQERYFLHHTCTHRDSEGVLFWQTWFDPEHRNGKPWCSKCPSTPPDEMRGLLMAMTKL